MQLAANAACAHAQLEVMNNMAAKDVSVHLFSENKQKLPTTGIPNESSCLLSLHTLIQMSSPNYVRSDNVNCRRSSAE